MNALSAERHRLLRTSGLGSSQTSPGSGTPTSVALPGTSPRRKRSSRPSPHAFNTGCGVKPSDRFNIFECRSLAAVRPSTVLGFDERDRVDVTALCHLVRRLDLRVDQCVLLVRPLLVVAGADVLGPASDVRSPSEFSQKRDCRTPSVNDTDEQETTPPTLGELLGTRTFSCPPRPDGCRRSIHTTVVLKAVSVTNGTQSGARITGFRPVTGETVISRRRKLTHPLSAPSAVFMAV